MNHNKNKLHPGKPDDFEENTPGRYFSTRISDNHPRWNGDAAQHVEDQTNSQPVVPRAQFIDVSLPDPVDTPEVQTITRFQLRLIAKDCVHYDRYLRCDKPESTARFLHQVLEGVSREVLGALYLDGQHHAIGYTIAYQGTLFEAPAEPRGILVPALLSNAASIILFHNHPSGDPIPSRLDEQTTERMKKAGETVGITVLDHIILGEAPRFVALSQYNRL